MPEPLKTPEMLLAHLTSVRDAHYESKLERLSARVTAIETIIQVLLERLIQEQKQ